MTEWPLIAFTVLLELACGSALAATVLDWTMRRSEVATMRSLGISIFPLAALALVISLFHLGRPLAAWRALTNLGISRLSLEVLLCALFAAAALGCSFLWWAGRSEGRLALGGIAGVLGIAAVTASALIYLIPAQPAWNSGWLPVSFWGTVLVLGGAFPFFLVNLRGGSVLQRAFLSAILAGGLALFLSTVWMVARLSQRLPDEFLTSRLQAGLHLLMSQGLVWLGVSLLLTAIVPIAAAIFIWRESTPPAFRIIVSQILFPAVLVGTVIGRTLMFAVAELLNP